MSATVFIFHPDRTVCAEVRRVLATAGFDLAEADGSRVPESSGSVLVLLAARPEQELRSELARLKPPGAAERRVIVLASQLELPVMIEALSYGADDCIGLPFSAEELSARVAAVLRRPSASAASEQVTAGPIVLDKAAHVLAIGGEPIELAPTEFRLLAFFLDHPGRVFSRGELLKGAWARHVEAGPRTVDVHVRRLRQILEPFGCEDMIQTVRGFGYRFVPGASERRAVPALRSLAKLARP